MIKQKRELSREKIVKHDSYKSSQIQSIQDDELIPASHEQHSVNSRTQQKQLQIIPAQLALQNLDDYLKFKIKPNYHLKQAVQLCQQYKRKFQKYIGAIDDQQVSFVEEGETSSLLQKFAIKNNRIFVSVKPSVVEKCIILIRDMNGNRIKFYDRVREDKKQEKIIKIIKNNSPKQIIITDYCLNQKNNIKSLRSIANSHDKLSYKMFNVSHKLMKEYDETFFNDCNIKFVQSKTIYAKTETRIHMFSSYFNSLLVSGTNVFQDIQRQMCLIEDEEEQFLSKIRKLRNEKYCSLRFDSAIIKLWRQTGRTLASVQTQLIVLFDKKINLYTTLMKKIESFSDQHLLKAIDSKENCQFCSAERRSNKKKARRTNYICQACSKQRNKLFYLCHACIEPFHQDICQKTCRKYQKIKKNLRSKKINKIKGSNNKFRKNISRSNDSKVKMDVEMLPLDQIPKEKDAIIKNLERYSSQMLEKLRQIIRDGRLQEAEYYLKMLINTHVEISKSFLPSFDMSQKSMRKIQLIPQMKLIKQES